MKINTKLLPRTSKDRSYVELKFSTVLPLRIDWTCLLRLNNANVALEDGKQMKLDAEKLGIKGVAEEVDRHSRILSRQEELTGN